MPHDAVLSPSHYTQHGNIECIEITEQLSFCLGNCIKYCWRYADKNGIEDLRKALWYLEREEARVKRMWFWQRWWYMHKLYRLAWSDEVTAAPPFPSLVIMRIAFRGWHRRFDDPFKTILAKISLEEMLSEWKRRIAA